jgi:CheY-like chemotaxis protein
MMPVMDGWQFLRVRRQDPRLAAVPVLIVSALDEGQAEAVALGVAGHLHKPVEPEELWSAIRTHTDRN